MKFNKIWFITLLFSLFSIATAQSGSIDPSFASNGVVTGIIGTGANFYVLRYNSNGSIDTIFSSGGVARISMSPDPDNEDPQDLAIQPDGKIIVAGWASIKSGKNGVQSFAVTRLNPDGSPDPSFGSNGRVLFNFANNQAAVAKGVAIQPNGAIVVAGRSSGDFAVARLLPNGAFDTSFNGTGKAIIKVGKGSADAVANSVKIQANGGIVLVGRSKNLDFAVVRLNPVNGSLDLSFGGTGIVLTSITGKDEGDSIVIQPDGKIVVAGLSNGAQGIALVRYLP